MRGLQTSFLQQNFKFAKGLILLYEKRAVSVSILKIACLKLAYKICLHKK